MKKAFVYLLIVMIFAYMVTGCGTEKKDDHGIIGATSSPVATEMPTLVPDATPSISPNLDSGSTESGSGGTESSSVSSSPSAEVGK